MNKLVGYDYQTLHTSKHWYVAWAPSLSAWRIKHHKGWCTAVVLGALSIIYFY